MTEASLDDRLTLADWRRRVAALYTEVRARWPADPHGAWELWRTEREALYRGHPQSPVPAADRATFRARHWPYDDHVRFLLPVQPLDEPETPAARPALTTPADPSAAALAGVAPLLTLPSSGADPLSFSRVGRVEIPFPSGTRSLSLFWLAGYAGGLFLPFRDATNGVETYGAGRYLLDAAKGADLGGSDGALILDANFSYQPSCAFDPKWACPLAPPENRLDIRVEAGERIA